MTAILFVLVSSLAIVGVWRIVDYSKSVEGTTKPLLVSWPQIQSALVTLAVLAACVGIPAGTCLLVVRAKEAIVDYALRMAIMTAPSPETQDWIRPTKEQVIRFDDDDGLVLLYVDYRGRVHVKPHSTVDTGTDADGWDVFSCEAAPITSAITNER